MYIVPLLHSNSLFGCDLNPSQSLKMTSFVGGTVEGTVVLWTEGGVITGRGGGKIILDMACAISLPPKLL